MRHDRTVAKQHRGQRNGLGVHGIRGDLNRGPRERHRLAADGLFTSPELHVVSAMKGDREVAGGVAEEQELPDLEPAALSEVQRRYCRLEGDTRNRRRFTWSAMTPPIWLRKSSGPSWAK